MADREPRVHRRGARSAAHPAPALSARSLTVIVHGTFAAAERWWRPGDRDASFADRLEAALARRGLPGTVWRPALEAGLEVTDFAWSGENRHDARLAGAKRLAASLAEVARRSGATADSPLVVYFVAHSHGGNVVLEAVRTLDVALPIRPGRIVLLGTPLIAFRPALRPFRLAVAVLLLAAVLAIGALALLRLAAPALPEAACPILGACGPGAGAEAVGLRWLLLLLAGALVGYRWIFMLLAALGDAVWRVAYAPFLALSGRRAGQAYGPEPGALLARFGGRKVVLVTSHQDEADLLLELSAAPRRLYEEWVATFSARRRVVEWLLVRPIVVGLVLRVLEMVLERFSFGFPWLRVLFFDHEMANLDTGQAYPPSLIERVDVTREIEGAHRAEAVATPAAPAALAGAAPPAADAAGLKGEERRVASLRQRVRMVVGNLLAQIRPRHSDYYRFQAVIERVADALAGAPASPAGQEER